MFENPVATWLRRGFLGQSGGMGFWACGFGFGAIFPAKMVSTGNIMLSGGVFPRQIDFDGLFLSPNSISIKN